MRLNGLKWITTALFVLATASTASAQKVTEERLQELIREAAARAGVTQTASATPGTAQTASTQSAQGDHPTVQLTLDEAIKLALDRNLDISVQRLNPQTFDFSVAGLQAVYKPTLTSTVSQQSATTPSNTTISGGLVGVGIVAGTTTYNGGLSQSMRWGGGTLAATLNNNRGTTTSTTALFDPQFNTNWSTTYTQPLMRNFKIDNTRQQLTITKLNQDISEIQLQATIINTLSNVRNAYWDYVFAVQSVDVARRSVALAEQLVKDNQTRVEVGTMAPIDVIQAQSQAATQRQNQAAAEGTRRTNELTLKRLIVGGTQDALWNATIDPVDRPDFVAVEVDVPAVVKRALDVRTDLAQVRKNLLINDVTLQYLKNQALPQFDLVAPVSASGQGGTVFHQPRVPASNHMVTARRRAATAMP